MTADWTRLPYDVLERISTRITNEVRRGQPGRAGRHQQAAGHHRVGVSRRSSGRAARRGPAHRAVRGDGGGRAAAGGRRHAAAGDRPAAARLGGRGQRHRQPGRRACGCRASPASAVLLAEGLEPVMQMTCRDRNRIALQSDLLAAGALGVPNVLLMTGDRPERGDHPDAPGVFDLDSDTPDRRRPRPARRRHAALRPDRGPAAAVPDRRRRPRRGRARPAGPQGGARRGVRADPVRVRRGRVRGLAGRGCATSASPSGAASSRASGRSVPCGRWT